MLSILLRMLTVLLVVGVSAPALAAPEVLMITWRGETPAERGFRDGLLDAFTDADIKHVDAGRERGGLARHLREEFRGPGDYDLVYTFGTTVSTTTAEYISRLADRPPHVFNIVSSPLGSGLVPDLERREAPLTGASHKVPIKTVAQVLSQAAGERRIAIWFDPREENSVNERDELVRSLKQLGQPFEVLRVVPDAQEDKAVRNVAEKSAACCEVLYLPSTSSYIDAGERLIAIAREAGLLVAGGSVAFMDSGAAMAISGDYYERGQTVADLAARILRGEHAGDIPVDVVDGTEAKIVVRPDAFDAADIDTPEGPNVVVHE